MNFKKMLSICKRSKTYLLYDLPDGEQMLSNSSCGYILYGHPKYTPETLRKEAIQRSAGTVLSASEYAAGMAAEILHGKTLLECPNTDLGTVAGTAIEERNNEE